MDTRPTKRKHPVDDRHDAAVANAPRDDTQEQVVFNVDGARFVVNKGTLRAIPDSLLAVLAAVPADAHASDQVSCDTHGEYFIARHTTHFPLLLHMYEMFTILHRIGHVDTWPPSSTRVQELLFGNSVMCGGAYSHKDDANANDIQPFVMAMITACDAPSSRKSLCDDIQFFQLQTAAELMNLYPRADHVLLPGKWWQLAKNKLSHDILMSKYLHVCDEIRSVRAETVADSADALMGQLEPFLWCDDTSEQGPEVHSGMRRHNAMQQAQTMASEFDLEEFLRGAFPKTTTLLRGCGVKQNTVLCFVDTTHTPAKYTMCEDCTDEECTLCEDHATSEDDTNTDFRVVEVLAGMDKAHVQQHSPCKLPVDVMLALKASLSSLGYTFTMRKVHVLYRKTQNTYSIWQHGAVYDLSPSELPEHLLSTQPLDI